MEWEKAIEDELVGQEDDLDFKPEDIVIDDIDNLPSISFSQKVHAQLVKTWQNTVVVKLLGRYLFLGWNPLEFNFRFLHYWPWEWLIFGPI